MKDDYKVLASQMSTVIEAGFPQAGNPVVDLGMSVRSPNGAGWLAGQ